MSTAADAHALGPAASKARAGEGFLWDQWYVAGVSADFAPGRPLARKLLAQSLLIGRTRTKQLYALRDRCPHRGMPLSAGRICTDDGGESIECPYHGWRFRPDGSCASIPSNADPTFPSGAIRVHSFPVIEQQNLIWVWMGSKRTPAPSEPPPHIPATGPNRPLAVAQIEYPVHVDPAIVGLVDPAHVPVVHRQWWWKRRANRSRKTKAFVPSELGFTMAAHAPVNGGRAYRWLGGEPRAEIVFRLPGLRWEHVRIGPRSVLALSAVTPVDERTTTMTQVIWSDHPMLRGLAPLIAPAMRRFLREDEAILRAQSRGVADNPTLLWVGDADEQGRWYLQLNREWVSSRSQNRPFVNPIAPRTLSWNS